MQQVTLLHIIGYRAHYMGEISFQYKQYQLHLNKRLRTGMKRRQHAIAVTPCGVVMG